MWTRTRRHLLKSLLLTATGFAATTSASFGQNPPTTTQPPTTGQAAPKKPLAPVAVEDLSIETTDGVKLRGKFYTGNQAEGKNGACVILMHAYQKEPTKGDWVGVANLLANKGYHVVQFDFRFHGGKTMDVIPTLFWENQFNAQNITGADKKPPRSELTFKDIRRPKEYYPALVNDIMAVRTYLDAQNDLGKVNTSTVYLLGAGDAASIGFLYMTAEWYREREVPNVGLPPVNISANRGLFGSSQPCGIDLAGAVWLSPARHLSMPQATIENFTSRYATRLREETPMLFISGEKDAKGKEGAKFFFERVLVAQPKPGSASKLAKLPLTYNREIKATNLAEAELLGKGLGTEDMIVEFMAAIDKDRKNKVAIPKRGYTKPLPVLFKTFGVGQ